MATKLALRSKTGYGSWYRRYDSLPNHAAEDWVCNDGDEQAREVMQARIALSSWVQQQVRNLRKLRDAGR